MSSKDRDIKIALSILEELCLRGGKCKLKYLKTYRIVCYWLGFEYAKYIIKKLQEGNYVRLNNEVLELTKKFSINKSLNKIISELLNLVKTV